MAKTQIKRLKSRRFWKWMTCEVYQKPKAIEFYRKNPIKQRRYRVRKRPKFWRELEYQCDKAWAKLQPMLERARQRAIAAGNNEWDYETSDVK